MLNKFRILPLIIVKVRRTHNTRSESRSSDETGLIERAKSGDPEAFARLYDAYIDRVYRFVYFRTSDNALAEDITSQVFLKAWEKLDHFQTGASPFLAWLYTVARNLIVDQHRSQRDMVPLENVAALPSDLATLDEEIQSRFDVQALRDALQCLSEDQQQVLMLKYVAGLPNETIAKMMNKQEGTIRGLKMRALQVLSRYMEEKALL